MTSNSITIFYLHGFQSSSSSQKAVYLERYLRSAVPDGLQQGFRCISPDLPFSPAKTLAIVERLISENDQVVLMGSSMGGFYAAYLSQVFSLPAVLINPVVNANGLFDGLVGVELENVYTGEQYQLSLDDLELLRDMESQPLVLPNLIFNCLETGDEVLDYRLAEKKYKICQQKVIQGGDHRFQNFEQCLPEILGFYQQALKCGM